MMNAATSRARIFIRRIRCAMDWASRSRSMRLAMIPFSE